MKFRIYKAMPAYPGYLKSFYKEHPYFSTKTFPEQIELHQNNCFQWILTWQNNNVDSEVEVFETISNDFVMQNTWAGKRYKSGEDWERAIVLEQIKTFRPDVCIIYPPEQYDFSFVEKIREMADGVIIGGYDGMDRQNASLYKGYDFVLTCSKHISSYYHDKGIPSYPMSFGFDKSVLNKLSASIKYGVGFSGSLYPKLHSDRFDFLSFLLNNVQITISSEFGYFEKIVSRRPIRQLKQVGLNRWEDYFRLCHHNIGPLYGIDMYQFLSNCAVVLNMHGNAIRFAANIRLFEATGVGTCLLTDWKENLPSIFEPDKEVLVYRTKEEALDIIRFVEKQPEFARRIAKNGQNRTLSDYSYQRLVPPIISFVKGFK